MNWKLKSNEMDDNTRLCDRIDLSVVWLAALILLCAGFRAYPRIAFATRTLDIRAIQSDRVNSDKVFQIRDVRIFDGTRVIAANSVIIKNGKIARVGRNLPVPPNTTVIDGSGNTLLPGLIDAHAHIPEEANGALRQSASLGVTTVLDMFTTPQTLKKIKEIESADPPNLADVRTAGIGATVSKGHPTEMGGSPIPTLSEPRQAQSFVDARIAEGSDYIKLIYDDYSSLESPSMRLPTLKLETLKALIAAAHKRGKLTVVHITDERHAREAVAAGVDGLAHMFIGATASPDFGRFVARHRVFVIATLSTLYPMCGEPNGPALLGDKRLVPFIQPEWRRLLGLNIWPNLIGKSLSCDGTRAGIRQLVAANVPILAGTDAPVPGATFGASLHGELRLLVEAGVPPARVLAGATSLAARIFHLSDRGFIRAGMRADLLLVRGDPTRDVLATRNIIAVWKRGVPIDRQQIGEQ